MITVQWFWGLSGALDLIRGAYLTRIGAANETRTRDIFVGNEVLYQLSYSRMVVIC